MRGTQPPEPSLWQTLRIIPADAGNTDTSVGPCLITEDHPRGCGEHSLPTHGVGSRAGSSPRMRGTPNSRATRPRLAWIIPADAGNTRACTQPYAGCQDHPRGCGEHVASRSAQAFSRGSSPRMRGTPRPHRRRCPRRRIIPADAGNTPAPSDSRGRIRDHPRGCGEHGTVRSSPRMA